eukprot:Platyproteum_vivax@DN7289_c0_g3_i3.p1
MSGENLLLSEEENYSEPLKGTQAGSAPPANVQADLPQAKKLLSGLKSKVRSVDGPWVCNEVQAPCKCVHKKCYNKQCGWANNRTALKRARFFEHRRLTRLQHRAIRKDESHSDVDSLSGTGEEKSPLELPPVHTNAPR